MPYMTDFVKTIFCQWYGHVCERVMQPSAGSLCAKMGGTPTVWWCRPLVYGELGETSTFSLAFLLACDGAVEELEVVLVGVARAVE
jgi:hypothetical protein